MKKILALVIALTLAIGLVPALAGEVEIPGADKVDLSKEVALKTKLIGDTPADNDMVYDAVNEVLKERLNTTLDIEYIPWSDAGTKYQLLFAGGDDFDQCYTAFWTTPVYQVLATKGAFMPLTEEMLTTYSPKGYAQLSQTALKQNQINGVLYTYPKSARAFDNKTVVLIRGDLREKYDIPEIKNLDDVNNYLHVIAENEKGIVPYQVEDSGSMIQSVFYTQAHNKATFTPASIVVNIDDKFDDPNADVLLMVDDPDWHDFVVMMKDWHDSGIIPADALSSTSSSGSGEAFMAGKSAMFAWNVNALSAYNAVMKDHPEWKPEVYDPADFEGTLSYPTSFRDGVAINPDSKNWERCLMVQEQLRTDKYLWDTSNYGIEGVHWIAIGDDTYEDGPETDKFPPNGSCQWGWQTDFQRVSATYPQSYKDIEAHWKETEYDFLLNGFAIDATEIKSIQATLENLSDEYYKPLSLGAVDDIDAKIAEYKSQMEKAGLAEYLEAAKKQIVEYADRMR